MKRVLNVGGSNRTIALPPHYAGWEQVLLDIDPVGKPDILCDARELTSLPGGAYESVYCSHNLEHYHHHDAHKVLRGFAHVLKEDGFAFIRVPDMHNLMRIVVERKLDIDDFLYQSPAGPIAVRDVIYGYGVEIERSGNDFYAHKTGFTQKSLASILESSGFRWVYTGTGDLEVTAFAFTSKPAAETAKLLGLPGQG